MVFSSYPFILFFLPAALALTLLHKKCGAETTILALAAASLVFYGYWNWRLIWVILLSIVVNYGVGLWIGALSGRRKKLVLISGLAFNLLMLGYFKYTNFFIKNLDAIFGGSVPHLNIVLPLGISFFTFQQVAYLVDVYQQKTVEHDFKHYLLFVTFFPQLIAGPIVHHGEMMPQFVDGRAGRVEPQMFSQGLAIFVLGIAKKVLIADPVARFATPVFAASANGVSIPFLEAWGGVLAYTFQIYFDFSAYSDMAIGLGLMFGLRLPINFNSPYKAASLIDFWRRWHITLARFLKEYLYIPLGGNRRGERRRYANLLMVMVLGGLWHGANWTFVIWGSLHGLGLAANHAFRTLRGASKSGAGGGAVSLWSGRLLTFLFVVVAWVFFRSDSLSSATNILNGMVGANGVVLPVTYLGRLGSVGVLLERAGVQFEPGYLFLGATQVLWLMGLFAVVVALPNTIEWAGYSIAPNDGAHPLVSPRLSILSWRPSLAWGVALSLIMIVSLVMMSNAGEFLYFQF